MELTNYIQYIDSNYKLKTKYIDEKWDSTDTYYGYLVNGIDTDYFILALYIENKRVDGVEFLNKDNLICSSVINDTSVIDLNTIEKSYFFAPFEEVVLNYTPSETSVRVLNFPPSGASKPARFVKQYEIPFLVNNTMLLDINPNGYQWPHDAFSHIRIAGLDGTNQYYIADIDYYINNYALDSHYSEGQSVMGYNNNYYYPNVYGVRNNNTILPFGDWFIKVNTDKATYPYGFYIMVSTCVYTNEVWLSIEYLQGATKKKELFNLDTYQCVNGGFKIRHTAQNTEIQISKVYG